MNTDNHQLERLFLLQAALMNALNITSFRDLPVKAPARVILNDPMLKDILINASGEVGEALEPLAAGTKPWKQNNETAEEVLDHIIEETVDVLFFLLEFWEFIGLSHDDVYGRYVEKWARNMERIAESNQNSKQVDNAVFGGYRGSETARQTLFDEENGNVDMFANDLNKSTVKPTTQRSKNKQLNTHKDAHKTREGLPEARNDNVSAALVGTHRMAIFNYENEVPPLSDFDTICDWLNHIFSNGSK